MKGPRQTGPTPPIRCHQCQPRLRRTMEDRVSRSQEPPQPGGRAMLAWLIHDQAQKGKLFGLTSRWLTESLLDFASALCRELQKRAPAELQQFDAKSRGHGNANRHAIK